MGDAGKGEPFSFPQPPVFMDCQAQHPCFPHWETPVNSILARVPTGGRQL